MKIATIAPCVFPTTGPIHFLMDSCKRNGIELLVHGVGEPYAGWTHMLMNYTVPHMKRLRDEGYTHVLCIDGRDTLVVGTLKEIVMKYEKVGSPPLLMSRDKNVVLNAGTYVGELEFIIDMWEGLWRRHQDDGDYQNWLLEEWPVSGVMLDQEYAIFQPMDDDGMVETRRGIAINKETFTYPCVLHFRGGYADPLTGRDERMRPVVEELWKDA